MKHEERFIKLGLNIAYYRKLRGLSQLELAEKADVSRTHISNIEAPNMKTSISVKKLFDIADILKVEPKQLIDFRNED